MLRRSPNVIRYRSHKNFDQSKFKYDLYVTSEIMSSAHNNVNLCTRAFCEYLATVIDLHFPLKTKTIRHNNVPYMNADLLKLQYQRNMLRIRKNKNSNPDNFERYRILRNKCVKFRLSSQRNYFEQRCDGGLKKCVNTIADVIEFSDPIPAGYENDAVLKTMIAKYDDHPSMIVDSMIFPANYWK